MFLNEIGKIADDCWSQIPNHFKNAELGDFIIMPNHVHGIIIINGMDKDVIGGVVETGRIVDNVETGHVADIVETGRIEDMIETGMPCLNNLTDDTTKSPTPVEIYFCLSAHASIFFSATSKGMHPSFKNSS
jgi:hypothetical protein